MEKNIYTFCLPDIGEGVVEGEVIEWLKNIDDRIVQDEPVVVVMTDKATVELPSPYPGVLQKQYYQQGQIAIKDKPLYDILLDETIEPSVSEEKKTEPTSKKFQHQVEEHPQIIGNQKNSEDIKAIPKVRHEARKWNIDINQISGSGRDGRVTEDDIHRNLDSGKKTVVKSSIEGDIEQQLSGIRGLMARKMHETHIPQFSFFEQVDVSRLMQLRQNIKHKAIQEGISLSYMPFFIRALSLIIKRFPQINASLDMTANKVILHQIQNMGIAMATPQGLIVPVLKNVEKMSLEQLIKAYEEMKGKVTNGSLSSADMKEATISLSNFGVLGGEGMWATPMIIDPQVAILAFARIRKVPAVKNDEIVIRDILPISWSFDHRLIDGELAAQISNAYCSLIREPAAIL